MLTKFNFLNKKDDLVLWSCKLCSYEWKGKSPYTRITRPYCRRCSSWSVRAKDWLINKEKWNHIKQYVLKRANWKCQACGCRINKSFYIHHSSYDNYYDVKNLVCLCRRCHFIIHGRSKSYIIGKRLLTSGIILISSIVILGIPVIIDGGN